MNLIWERARNSAELYLRNASSFENISLCSTYSKDMTSRQAHFTRGTWFCAEGSTDAFGFHWISSFSVLNSNKALFIFSAWSTSCYSPEGNKINNTQRTPRPHQLLPNLDDIRGSQSSQCQFHGFWTVNGQEKSLCISPILLKALVPKPWRWKAVNLGNIMK